jgi:hypothetical protein
MYEQFLFKKNMNSFGKLGCAWMSHPVAWPSSLPGLILQNLFIKARRNFEIKPVRLSYQTYLYFFYLPAVFFSHNKLVNSHFSHNFSDQRTGRPGIQTRPDLVLGF